MNRRLTYVLVTPARDEAAYLERTVESIADQAVRPRRWVIVSDGSTDGTPGIVERYRKRHDWIDLVCLPARRERHFAGKVAAFDAGYATMKGLEHDLVGNVDADTSFEPDYFEFLLGKFAEDPGLGVAGTPFREGDRSWNFRFSSDEHVSGGCQVFRRECFEAIGGYLPLDGGTDLVAALTARMKGWRTRSFVERTYVHHRPMGSARHGTIGAKFKLGMQDYALGGHPLWQVARSVYQMTRPPLMVGGSMLLGGYLWATLRRMQRPVSRELVEFYRREQMRRLRRLIAG